MKRTKLFLGTIAITVAVGGLYVSNKVETISERSYYAEELLSKELSASQVLYRLYHEDGVRVYTQKIVQHTCRCSYEKVSTTLASFPREEIEDMSENGLVTVTCEFCKTDYRFSKEDVASLFE